MKKAIVLLCLLMTVLFAGCTDTNAGNPALTLPLAKDGSYSGFSDLPPDNTIKNAEKDGSYVICDMEDIANRGKWDAFVNKAQNKKNAFVRIAQDYSENSGGPYFTDLYYREGYYYLFDSSAGPQTAKPYKYLLTLTGQDGIPKKESTVIVLTDDSTLSFDVVMRKLYSSSGYSDIPDYKIVLFR